MTKPKFNIGTIQIVGVSGFRVFCKCGATMHVSGTVAGVRAAVKLWAQDHGAMNTN